MGYWGVVNNCIKNADIIVIILDARIPKETQNPEIERKAREKSKEIYYVMNKSDLITTKQKESLKKEYPNAAFVSAKKKAGIEHLKKTLEAKQEGDRPLRIALLGYPNVGKSSILNLLAPEAKAKTSTISGTTKKTQWIRIGNLRIMDTPGVIPNRDSKTRVAITASKDPHKIPVPEKVATQLIQTIQRTDKKILEKAYGITIQKEDTPYDILLTIGEHKKYKIKGGDIDEHRVAITIITDWQKGKLGLK